MRLPYRFRAWCEIVLVVTVAVTVGYPATGRSQDITPFRLTGIDGFLSLRAFFDEDTSTRNATGAESKTRQRQRTFEEEIHLLAHSYIYHPNFLQLDFGGGVLFNQERFKADGERRTTQDALYNATGRLSILRRKPYPLVLFFDRVTTPVSAGVVERFLQTDTRYGFIFSFLEPLAPIPLAIEGFRRTLRGEGATQVTDETADHLSVSAHKTLFRKRGTAALSYQFDRQDSASGDSRLPIDKTRITTHAVNLSTRLAFGSLEQIRLQNLVSYFDQLQFPARQDLQVNPTFQWQLTDAFSWSARYSLGKSRVEGLSTTNQAMQIAFNHRLYRNLFTTVDVHGDENRTTGLHDRTYGGGVSVSYRKKIDFVSLTLEAGAVYDIKDQQTTARQIPVFGESHALNGSQPVDLDRDDVLLSTVTVFNATRSRTFRQGVDYQLTVVGVKTRIQRLLGGDIQDGETVLVDYAFATTGTFSYAIFDQHYGVSVSVFSYLTLFARFREAPQRLLSGDPTRPLNSIHSRLYGFQFRVPIDRFAVGGEGGYEHHREDISSYRRLSFSAFVQIPLPASTALLLRGRRVWVNNLDSPEDVDLIGVDARLESRPWSGFSLSAEASYEKDTGGTLQPQIWRGTLLAEWRIGQLLLRVEGGFRRDQQVDLERDRITGKINVRRTF